MIKRFLSLVLLISMILLILSSCSTETIKPDQSFGPTQPSQSSSSSPTATMSQPPDTPSPTPSPTATQKTKVDYAYLTSQVEEFRLEINNNETITYSGNIGLTLYFENQFDQDITDHIYINNELINPKQVSVRMASIIIALDETQPEHYSLIIKDTELSEEFKVNFIHDASLTCDISIADPMVSTFLESPLYLSTPSQIFSFVFNKPVDKQTLLFPDFMNDYEIETLWLSDTEMILTVHNLSISGHGIGIGYILGKSPGYGNKMQYSGRILDPMSYDCTYYFQVSNRQKLYSIIPETNVIKILDDFDYAMIFEDATKDLEFLSLGIITNEQEGWQYAKVIYNIESGELTPLDTFISDSVSTALQAEITTYATNLYNPMVANEYWNNENEYHYFFGNSIYNISPEDYTAEIYYSSLDTSSYPYPVFHMDNGNLAVIKRTETFNNNYILQVIGSDLTEYQLPFKIKTGEGWIRYIVHIADAGENRLLVSGYEFKEGEENLLSTYNLNLDDGSMTLVTKKPTLIDYFSKTKHIVYANYNPETNQNTWELVSPDGSLIAALTPNTGFYFSEIIFNSYNNVYYISKYNQSTDEYSILSLDATTFELSEPLVIFDRKIWLIGVNSLGELLVMDGFN